VWLHPEQNLSLLNLTDAMTGQYLWTGEIWLESTLTAALPSLPDNPNVLMNEWDASQFGVSSWMTPP
jgi:hypothetical protein